MTTYLIETADHRIEKPVPTEAGAKRLASAYATLHRVSALAWKITPRLHPSGRIINRWERIA